jgi:hypothetical protein
VILNTCLSLPCVSATDVAFINSINCSGFAISCLLCACNNFTIELCHIWWSFRFLESLFHNYVTWQIGTSTFRFLTSKAQLVSGEIAHACWERPVSWYRNDSLAPDIVSDFNTFVTSNIFQSVFLWPWGSWRKEAD